MKDAAAGKILVPAISAVLHVLAFLQFILHPGVYGLPGEWTRDYDLLLLSFLLIPVIHAFSAARVRITVAVIRIVVFASWGFLSAGSSTSSQPIVLVSVRLT